MIFQSAQELESALQDIVSLNDKQLILKDEVRLREEGIDHIVETAVLADDAQARHLARVFIRKLAKELDVYTASIYGLYEAFGKGEVEGFTVPAMNIRTLTYDVACEIFKTAMEREAGAFIFEISRTEIVYTDQTQDEFANAILAAAIKTGFKGPVFLQGDHYQFDLEKFKKYPQGQIDEIQLAIKDALSAGFYNIDIDASTLVDLQKPTEDEQQEDNIEMTALMTQFIRSMQPGGITATIGGEIGHIGGVNSTVEDFEAFMQGYIQRIEQNGLKGISKVSVQTGTTHGGVVNPDGTLKEMDVDFSVLRSIGKAAREKYGLAGSVQHGASTLPPDKFDDFTRNNVCEIHLATGFQNLIFDAMPEALRQKLIDYTMDNFKDERKDDWDDEQFVYRLRKKSLGPHKKEIWAMQDFEKTKVRQKLGEELDMLFDSLNLAGTAHTIRKYIGPRQY